VHTAEPAVDAAVLRELSGSPDQRDWLLRELEDGQNGLPWQSTTRSLPYLRGRFRLRDAGPDGIRVTFRLSYRAPGGLLGLIADRIAARQVGRELQRSLANVRAMVEP
jgi:uncharacterized membrane protein